MSRELSIEVPAEHDAIRRWIARYVCERRWGARATLVPGGSVWRFTQGDLSWSIPAASPMQVLRTPAVACVAVAADGAPLWSSPLPVPEAAFHGVVAPEAGGRVAVDGVAWLDVAAALLAGIDELASSERDAHGRVPASATWLGRADATDAPVVDQIVELLRAALLGAGFDLARRPEGGRVAVSHDVDVPFIARPPGLLRTPRALRRAWLGQLGAPRRRAVAGVIRATLGDASADPVYTFDRLLADHASAGRTATAYVLADASDPLDARYRLDDPEIRALLRAWCAAGHRVGVHGGYGTWRDRAALTHQATRLREVLASLGCVADAIGGRQHYLRWDPALTPAHYVAAGLTHDATLGFAERPGFRRGTAWAFPAFDVAADRALPLDVEPLHLMEVSLFAERYSGYAYDAPEAWSWVDAMRARVAEVGGCWSVLWHNTELVDSAAWTAYQRAISPLA